MVHGVRSEVQTRMPGPSPAVQAIELAGKSHTHLKKVPFGLAMFALGLETNPQRARLLRMNAKTIATALEGGPISGEFIGNLMTGLKPYAPQLARVGLDASDIDTFFEVA